MSLLLLVSIFNLIASPVSLATRASNSEAAPLEPFDEPTEFIRRIPLITNDLVYNDATDKLYASVPSSAGSSGNSIVTIDPVTGIVGGPVFVGSEPNKLALSDDGQSLYVSLDGSFAIRRFNVATNTPGLQFTIGQDTFSGRFSVNDFAVAPGNPDLLAVARSQNAGVAVFDNGVRRPNVSSSFSSGSDFLAFSASASKLYGTGFSNGLTTMTIDASGVTVSSTGSLAAGARIKFSGGKIFSSVGHVINPDTNTLLGTFFLGNSFSNFNTTAFVPDTAAGRAYYLTPGPTFGTLTLKAFDINTFLLLGLAQHNRDHRDSHFACALGSKRPCLSYYRQPTIHHSDVANSISRTDPDSYSDTFANPVSITFAASGCVHKTNDVKHERSYPQPGDAETVCECPEQ